MKTKKAENANMKKGHTPTNVTAVAAPELEIKRGCLPPAELQALRLWLLQNTRTDGAGAKEIGVQIGVLYRARRGLVLSGRSLWRIMEFLKKLPVREEVRE